MAQKYTRDTVDFIRKMQKWAPFGMVVIAALVYLLWKDEQSSFISALIAFLAIPDYFAFKIIGDQMEANLDN